MPGDTPLPIGGCSVARYPDFLLVSRRSCRRVRHASVWAYCQSRETAWACAHELESVCVHVSVSVCAHKLVSVWVHSLVHVRA
jgi:hypothetical protein